MFRLMTALDMPEDQWLSLFDFRETHPNECQYLWLSERASMTNRLSMAGNGPPKIELITAEHKMPVKEERIFLNLRQRSWSYVREVIIHVDKDPWMFGRTIIPTAALNGSGGKLKLLGEKPLGQVLFHNNVNSRISIEVAKISKTHHLYPTFIDHEKYKCLWARRSLFHFQNFPILVQEVFLPDCPFQDPE